jgi:hypothetical protein
MKLINFEISIILSPKSSSIPEIHVQKSKIILKANVFIY